MTNPAKAGDNGERREATPRMRDTIATPRKAREDSMAFRQIIGTSKSKKEYSMNKLNGIKDVEVGDAEFQITMLTGETVNISAQRETCWRR